MINLGGGTFNGFHLVNQIISAKDNLILIYYSLSFASTVGTLYSNECCD